MGCLELLVNIVGKNSTQLFPSRNYVDYPPENLFSHLRRQEAFLYLAALPTIALQLLLTLEQRSINMDLTITEANDL